MPRAIRIHETGGPEVMRLEDVDVAAPGVGEVQVRHTAIGLNFIDVYDRSGLYPQKSLPAGHGREAVGVVTAIGRSAASTARGPYPRSRRCQTLNEPRGARGSGRSAN